MNADEITQLKWEVTNALDTKTMFVTGYNILAGAFISAAKIDMTIKLLTAFSIVLGCVYVMIKICFVIAKWRKLNEKDIDS